ncbi:OFA family MFS transporter [Spiractinospora alimapuensis]|uniref:L-lactate MFS transporter n=1 Tax=Spiractinospora alimapuensis TaxID=2820884 RepID=UPI001F1E7A1E|nr:OFA family MFS transporter [Spiractinospora alimapuensis]QVQ52076.1 OFA family MFS transporter [Spiractinospora alimapuensis]
MLTFLDRERSVAPHGFNRWLIPPAALAVHLSIGQVYAFSVFNNPLAERFGTQQTPIAVIFSISIVMLGLSAAFGGKWVERNGPRKAMFVSGLCWVSGFLVSAVGVATGQLWLVYLGYGFIGGIGLGIGYISPVSTLIKWFPDRPGLATGMAIMGFGGGALIASPLSDALMNALGASPSEAIVPTFLVLAGAYLVAMMLGAATVRVPPPGWTPQGTPADADRPKKDPATEGVSVEDAFRTRQFWLCWIVLFCNVTAGIGILQQAAPMIQDYFPAVTAAAAAGFVGVLSLCNMGGRFIWSSTSDIIGRKPTYIMYLGVGAVLYLLVLTFGTSSVVLFVALTGIILTFYGGGFATVPAYLKDLFGSRNVGAIHGRLLTAWSAAGVAGPLIVSAIADHQKDAGYEGADVYTLSLQVMIGVMVVGFIANMLIRPMAERAKNTRGDTRVATEV